MEPARSPPRPSSYPPALFYAGRPAGWSRGHVLGQGYGFASTSMIYSAGRPETGESRPSRLSLILLAPTASGDAGADIERVTRAFGDGVDDVIVVTDAGQALKPATVGSSGQGARRVTTLREALESARGDVVAVGDPLTGRAAAETALSLADRGSPAVITERQTAATLAGAVVAAYMLLVRVLLGIRGHGFVIGPRSQLAAAAPDALGLFALAETVARAKRHGTEVVEVRLPGRCQAVAPPIRTTVRAGRDLLRFWWNEVLHRGPAGPASSEQNGGWASAVALLALCGLLFFTDLSHQLVEPDEGRHGEIPREMYATGNWLVPHFNGDPYYDKPPLFYWLVATSYATFGVSERSARLVPATAMTLTVLALFLWGRRRFGVRPARLGAGMLALSPGAAYVGRFVVLDALLDLLVAAALMLAHEAVRAGRVRYGWWLGSAVCCGLGLLAKGPVSLALTLPPVAAFAWLDAGAARPRIGQWLLYGGVAVSIAAPWFLAAIVNDPEYARYFFWEHNVSRFLAGADHPEPLWYYVPVLLLGCLPWSLLLVPLAPFLLSRSERLRALRPRGVGFLALWAGWCLAFFTASSGKLPTYILPALPPICLLLGLHLDRLLLLNADLPLAGYAKRFVPRYGAATLCWAGVVVVIGVPLFDIADYRAVLPMLVVWTLCLLGLGVTWWRVRTRPSYVACAVITLVGVLYATHDLLPRWAERRSLFSDAGPLDGLLKDSAVKVGCWGNQWGSVPFYLGRSDVRNFDHGGVKRLQGFLSENERVCLVLKGDYEAEHARAVVPSGRRLTRLGEIGDPRLGAAAHAGLFLVEPRSARPSAFAARWSAAAAGDRTGKL